MKIKEPKTATVSARVKQEHSDLLKAHNVNISALLQDAVEDAVKQLSRQRKAR